MAAAARLQTYKIGKRRMRLYSNVEVVESAAPETSSINTQAPPAAPPAAPAPRAAQLDMFPAAVEPTTDSPLVGLAVTLPDQCPRCRGHDAVIGAGRGPHKASIMCVCGCHRRLDEHRHLQLRR